MKLPEILLYGELREKWIKSNPNLKMKEEKARFLQRDYEQKAIYDGFKETDHKIHKIEGVEELKTWLKKALQNPKILKSVVAWNITDGYDIYNGANLPAFCKSIGIPYVMEHTYIQCLAQNKHHLKEVLHSIGFNTPKTATFFSESEVVKERIPFEGPYFIKPAKLDNSIALSEKSKCQTTSQAVNQARHVLKKYESPVMVEEFIEGIDVTVPYAFFDGNCNIQIYTEEYLEKYNGFQTAQLKDGRDKKIKDHLEKEKQLEIFKRLIDFLELESYGRFDLKQNTDGELFFIEFNPGTSLTCLSFEKALEQWGMTLREFLSKMATQTWERHYKEYI